MFKAVRTGIDLCRISRMAELQENDAFLHRVLSDDEIAYFQSKGVMAAASLAGLWAIKEAVLKAAGEGLGIPMRDIEITHDGKGKPSVHLRGKANEILGGALIDVSVTHEGDYAAAVCTALIPE